MCNKRPLHQPASNGYCGSVPREPYNPFNHGRAEKAGGYSSVGCVGSTPVWDSDKVHPNTRRQQVVQGLRGEEKLRRLAQHAVPLARRTGAYSEVMAPAQHRRLCSSCGFMSVFGRHLSSAPRTPGCSLASAERWALISLPTDFLKAICTADRS